MATMTLEYLTFDEVEKSRSLTTIIEVEYLKRCEIERSCQQHKVTEHKYVFEYIYNVMTFIPVLPQK